MLFRSPSLRCATGRCSSRGATGGLGAPLARALCAATGRWWWCCTRARRAQARTLLRRISLTADIRSPSSARPAALARTRLATPRARCRARSDGWTASRYGGAPVASLGRWSINRSTKLASLLRAKRGCTHAVSRGRWCRCSIPRRTRARCSRQRRRRVAAALLGQPRG